jgi:DNA-binding LytR/AlgR family response regulator
MRVVIIEDEELAVKRLESMISQYDPAINVLAKLESVEQSVEWFEKNPEPDLLFLDIHLEDDISFTIFEKVKITCPIIFTTAFDEYAIKAFKHKSIDYLLKPILQADLNKAIDKYKDWTGDKKQMVDVASLYDMITRKNENYKERYSVSVGEKLKSISVTDIAYFFSTSGITFMVTNSKSQFSLDISLETLATELNPKDFFRVNRQYLVKLQAIQNVHVFPKSRLKLDLNPPAPEEIYVSLDKVAEFKTWLDGGK